ncbi:hypothetical protein [Deefgea sp. CFH1-16]|uniref:hypothetical protein n=1 Tax=Deefgea sp. CFH1-16 TaxID=2675457 RepID=UPI0015F3BA5F|nr:hypothetical protein [Deefgea sp. CFH1-16]MBM5575804.1 hypothetical protein [Deefgea sp. CFH1-16]
MSKAKPKRAKKYDPTKHARLLIESKQRNEQANEQAKMQAIASAPLVAQEIEHFHNLSDVHTVFIKGKRDVNISQDILLFFIELSRNLASFKQISPELCDAANKALHDSALHAINRKLDFLDLSTGQKKAFDQLNGFSKRLIQHCTRYQFVESYNHARQSVIDINRQSGIIAAFGEMPEIGQPYITYEQFIAVITGIKASVEASSTQRYIITRYSLELDEVATAAAEAEAIAQEKAKPKWTNAFLLTAKRSPLRQHQQKKTKKKPNSDQYRIQRLRELADERLATVLERLPLLFTSATADKICRPDYCNGESFKRSALTRPGLIRPTGKKHSNAIEFANSLHPDYPQWLENQNKTHTKTQIASQCHA